MSHSGDEFNIVLNFESSEVKKQPPPRKPKQNETTSEKVHKRDEAKSFAKPPTRKRKYIDPKDFVPISTLFEKNPEIPKLEGNMQGSTNKTQKVVFSSNALEDLPINQRLKGNLKDQFHFDSLTQVQVLAIPTLLEGKDATIKSPTGSGKTMCYAIPIVDKLSELNPPVERSHGPYAVILLPTRELALQTYNVFQDLCKSAINIVPGLLVGGEKCKAEKGRLRKGINILIATPGRLTYHLKETACLHISNLSFLVLDEVDRLLDMGFKRSVIEIVNELDKRGVNNRQTVLLSATLDTRIKALASVTTKDPVVIDDTASSINQNTVQSASADFVVPSSLDQYYVFVPAKLRLVSLFLFLMEKCFAKTKEKSKVIVFMPNKCSVAFNAKLFSLVVEKLYAFGEKSSQNVFQLHGDMRQAERFETFKKFKTATKGVLFCTDVAARGLDIKKVDWIVQFSCPLQIEDYLHKVGRTARIGLEGSSLLFLLPSESDYVALLAKESIILEEMKVEKLLEASIKSIGKSKHQRDEETATELQNFIEETVVKDKGYYDMGLSAYSSYIQSYSSYPSAQKDIFHVKKLHLGHLAKSFGLREAPGVFKSKVVMKEQVSTKEPLEKKRKPIPKDGIFSGPRPGKQKNNNNKKKKKKLRV